VTPNERAPDALPELARIFLRLGATAFGGPAAHVALMEDELVRRRAWVSRAEFLDLVGATNLIPGPNSTELALHLGRRHAGWAGFFVAGACFILPAALVVGLLAWAYVRFGRLPEIAAVLQGVKPVMIALVAQALWGLGRTAAKTRWLWAVGLGAVIASALGFHELVVLLAAGLLGMAARAPTSLAALVPAWPAFGVLAASSPLEVSLPRLFFFFLKIGSVLFGSGYVLLAFVRADLVERWGWLTEAQLLDAVAVGQITPGPLFTTATFIGYLLGGAPGAVLATVGIFLPAFAFVAISGPLVPKLRGSPVAGAFLDGVNVGSLALMGVVTWQLGRAALIDIWTVALALLAALLLMRWRVGSTWLIGGGALAGVLLYR
jgi:chromate transporter